MIPDIISPYLFAYGWMLALSGLLLLFYRIFLFGRHTYRFQRSYLLAIPSVSLFGLLLQCGCCVYEKYAPAEVLYLSQEEAVAYQTEHPGAQILSVSAAETTEIEPEVSSVVDGFPWLQLLLGGILLVSLLLMLVAVFQMLRIYVWARRMKAEMSADGYRVVRSEQVQTPFSFGTTIFLPQGRSVANEEVLLRHEKAHVHCRHYIDVWTVELLVRLMWFNPLLWLVRRTLRHLHEFEADRFVLDSGIDKLAYQTLLLEELMENSSVVTNGFNHSFVRRRFLEMRRPECVTLNRWGRAVAFSWVALLSGVFVAYGLSWQRPTVVRIKTAMPTPSTPLSSLVSQEVVAEDFSKPKEETAVLQEGEVLAQEEFDESPSLAESVQEKETARPTHAADGWPILYELPLAESQETEELRLIRREKETLLTFVHTETQDDHLYRFGGPDSYIVDPATGVHYKARRSIPEAAWHYFHLSGMKGKTWKVTVVFPPLPETMEKVSFYQVTHHLQTGWVYDISSIESKE
ncbi:MAG: hypothetical protein J6C15_03905 [Bacteroidaceae bacterium]|nr:hypothetical protein [Bacteroidaceae bacterium]